MKTISQLEQERGLILKAEYVKSNKIKPNDKISEAEFDAIESHHKHGVDHATRVEFLTDNGFEVTRENMIDHRLSAGRKIIVDGEILDYDKYLEQT